MKSIKVSNSAAKTSQNGYFIDPEVGKQWAWPNMAAI